MATKLRQRMSEQFSGIALPSIAFGVGLNLVLGHLITLLKLPIYLDNVGTVLIAILVGPIAGITAGVIAAIIGGILLNPFLPYYIPVVCAIGGLAGYLAKRGFFRTWPTLIIGGILQALLAAVIAAPITTYLFGGITLAGSSFIVAYLRSTGEALFKSVILAGLAAEPVDKTLVYILAFLIARRLPRSLLLRYPGAENIRTL
jgi:energy-coupling factor transport system substrate-specific component